MQHYVGTKTLKATPMTRAAYTKFRGWELPADENGDDDGYLVEYTDGGNPNVATHAGYVSWTPKAQFEAAYVKLPDNFGDYAPHQQRVIAEEVELEAKLTALSRFINSSPTFLLLDAAERERLAWQQRAMLEYVEILNARIDAFVVA